MANRNFPSSRLYSGHPYLVEIDFNFLVGASGAVSSLNGPFVQSVTRKAAGVYSVRLMDNYSKLYAAIGSSLQTPTTGSAIVATSFVSGTTYQIVTLGTTPYASAGLSVGIVPAVGATFISNGASTGSGTAIALATGGIGKVEVMGINLQSTDKPHNNGAEIIIATLAATSSSVTTAIPTDPAQGAVVGCTFLLGNSSVSIQGG